MQSHRERLQYKRPTQFFYRDMTEGTPVAPYNPGHETIDEAVLAQLAASRDPIWVLSLLTVFVDELADKRSQIEAFIAERKYDQLRRPAHSLAGAASMVGAQALVHACRAIEAQCRARSSVDRELALALFDAIDMTCKEYDRYRSRVATSATRE